MFVKLFLNQLTFHILSKYQTHPYQQNLQLLTPLWCLLSPGKSYSARVAPSHLNVFLNLASLYSKDPTRLMEAYGVCMQIMDILMYCFTQCFVWG